MAILYTFRQVTLALAIAACVFAASGCGGHRRPPTTQPIATDIDPELATTAYWLSQPASASVVGVSYDRLFAACDHVLRQRRFIVDRTDFRDGILSSRPLISQQIWEPWRDDVGSLSGQTKSSLATYRRTVQWTIQPGENDQFIATPRVVIERFSAEPARITTVTSYRSAANSVAAQTKLDSPILSAVTTSRWYAVGRDTALEGELANHASDWLIGK